MKMSNKNSSQVIMNDQQYYNGGYTKPGTLNKSTVAAMSRENLNHGQQRRMEPKHLQQPRPRSTTMQHQPDIIQDYSHTNGIPNGHQHSYQPEDSLRRSQGTNTKAQQQREFQIQNPQVNGRHNGHDATFRSSVPERRESSSTTQNRELVMHKHKSVNGISVQDSRPIEAEKRPRPRSRGVSANSSAIELIQMNYSSIQQQLERNLRPPSRMKVEDSTSTEQNLSSSTGRKTPHDLSQTLPVDDSNRNQGRMSQAEIVRNRNMAASRTTPVEPPHLRKSRTEESSPGYQHFTPDKVSPIVPIPKKRHDEAPRRSQSQDRNPESENPIPRARIPPHERNPRMSKEIVDQRKPRAETEVVMRRNPPPHMSTRQQPMGAESIPVQRPATSMGFARTATNRSQNKENEQQLNVRQKLELLQRRKSGGPNLESNYKEFVADNGSPQARPDSVGQRPPSGQNRRKSYTTSTPAKAEDRLHPKATEKLRQSDGRSSRTSSDSSSSKDPSRSSRTNVVAPQTRGPASVPSFQERSTNRWKEIEFLSSNSPDQPDNRRNGRRGSRGDYPFFLDFSKSTPEITNSLDSLNQDVSDHLGAQDRSKINGDSNKLSVNSIDRKMTLEDLDFQGTPQLSSPVDFNPDGSSNEDLDLEVRTLLGQSENGGNTLDMALYQKLINEAVYKKVSSLRDRSSMLDRKDGDLKSKRERLQRRMQQTLSKTTAMLNKSVELEKSRVHVDLEVMDPVKAEELAVIHALSSTVRPKTPSGSTGRPQHVSDSFHNHSTIIHNDTFPSDTFESLYSDSCTRTTCTNFSQSCTQRSDSAESDVVTDNPQNVSEVNEASLSFSFDSIAKSQTVHKGDKHKQTMSCVLVSGSTFYKESFSASVSEYSSPEFHSLEPSSSAAPSQDQSEINETSLSFSFHSIQDGDHTELNLSQCEPSASISEYSQVRTPRSKENSLDCGSMQDSGLDSSQCVTPDLSIIHPCPSETPKTFVYPMAKRLLFGKSRCSYDFSFSPCRPPNVTSGNMTSDQFNSIHHPTVRPTNRVTTEKRKNMFSSTPVPEKQRRINSASVNNTNFKRFSRMRRVVNAKHARRVSMPRGSISVKRKGTFMSPSAKRSKTNLSNSSSNNSVTFRRFALARRITVRQAAKTGALKVRSIPLPKN